MYSRHSTLDPYLAKVRQHNEPYSAVILDKEILIYPNVMSPKYDRSAQMFIQMLPEQKEKKFLEIGSGTGVVSVFVAMHKPSSITAVDINTRAVLNTQENFNLHRIAGRSFRSDPFENIEGKFDTIFFNAPFHGSKPQDELEMGTCDEEYRTLRRFIREAGHFLEKAGEIHLGFADSGDSQLLRELIVENGYLLKNFQTQLNGDWSAFLYTLCIA
jgi:16S rRNA G1207 methylase RsmC